MKRMMSGLILAAISLIPRGGHAAWSPTITEYDRDAAGWNAAVNNPCTEDFNDTALNPGLTFASTYPGLVDVDNGVWWDRLNDTTITTWNFAAPIYAFGGTWNLDGHRYNDSTPGPCGTGTSIDVLIQGVWVPVSVITNDHGQGEDQATVGEFWGFVSNQPFTAVRLKAKVDDYGNQIETYELDDMVYAYAANSPYAQPFTTSGIILTRTGANNDQAQFKLKGVTGIKAAAQAAKANGVVDALTFTVAASCDCPPIITLPSGAIPSSSLTVTDTQMRYIVPLGNGNLDEVRCVFSTEECVVNIKGVDFDNFGCILDDTTVSMTVGGKIYTETVLSGGWTQEDSGSGSWTKYRK